MRNWTGLLLGFLICVCLSACSDGNQTASEADKPQEKAAAKPETQNESASDASEPPKSRVFTSMGRAFVKGMAGQSQQDPDGNGNIAPPEEVN